MGAFFYELVTIGFIMIDNYFKEDKIICSYNIKLRVILT